MQLLCVGSWILIHICKVSQLLAASEHKDILQTFTPLALSFSAAYFGEGSGSILLDDVGCSGTEEALLNCSYSNHNCGHSEDASVRCKSSYS